MNTNFCEDPYLNNSNPRPKMPWVLKLIFMILVGILIVCWLASCSVMNKQKTVDQVKTDSTVAVTVDSSHVVKKDSVGEKTDTYERETVIEFDTARDWNNEGLSFGDIATDHINPKGSWFYEGKEVTEKEFWELFNKDHQPPIKKITIREKGIKTEKSHVNTLDTAGKKEVSKVTLHKSEKVKEKDVHRTRYGPLIIWSVMGLVVIIILIRYRKKIISYLKNFLT